MLKVKYISLKYLKKNLEKIIDSVLKREIEYIIMIDKEPKIRISLVNDKEGQQVILKEIEKQELKKFID